MIHPKSDVGKSKVRIQTQARLDYAIYRLRNCNMWLEILSGTNQTKLQTSNSKVTLDSLSQG